MRIKKELEAWEKEFLQPYCLEQCAGSCCQTPKQTIFMTEPQLRKSLKLGLEDVLEQSEHYALAGTDRFGKTLYYVETYFGKKNPHCPSYNQDTNLCRIQEDKPSMCKQYPLELGWRVIKLAATCQVSKHDNPALRQIIDISQAYKHALWLWGVREGKIREIVGR
jgi:Fe-S-cluster containining protein